MEYVVVLTLVAALIFAYVQRRSRIAAEEQAAQARRAQQWADLRRAQEEIQSSILEFRKRKSEVQNAAAAAGIKSDDTD